MSVNVYVWVCVCGCMRVCRHVYMHIVCLCVSVTSLCCNSHNYESHEFSVVSCSLYFNARICIRKMSLFCIYICHPESLTVSNVGKHRPTAVPEKDWRSGEVTGGLHAPWCCLRPNGKASHSWCSASCVDPRSVSLSVDRLIGLVVKASALRVTRPRFNSRFLCEDFSGSSHNADLKIGTQWTTLPGAWRFGVSTGTGLSGVSILWLGEIESLICNFYLGVAAHKIVWADPSLRYTGMLLGWEATNKHQFQFSWRWYCSAGKGTFTLCHPFEILLFVDCLTSQQHARISQGWVYLDSCTCCHTEMQSAEWTCCFTQSWYTDSGPPSPSTNLSTPSAWKGSH